MTASLEAHGFTVDGIPNHPKMGALVKAAAELGPEVVSDKRAAKKVLAANPRESTLI